MQFKWKIVLYEQLIEHYQVYLKRTFIDSESIPHLNWASIIFFTEYLVFKFINITNQEITDYIIISTNSIILHILIDTWFMTSNDTWMLSKCRIHRSIYNRQYRRNAPDVKYGKYNATIRRTPVSTCISISTKQSGEVCITRAKLVLGPNCMVPYGIIHFGPKTGLALVGCIWVANALSHQNLQEMVLVLSLLRIISHLTQ